MKVRKAGAFVDLAAPATSDAVAGGASTTPATHVGSTTAAGAAGTMTINVPAGVQAGDLMLLNFELQDSTDVLTVPTGWTALYDAESGAATSWKEMVGCWKVAGASEPASYVVTISNGSHGFSGAMTVYRNAGTPTLVGTAIDGAAFPAATVTTGTLVIGVAGNNSGTGPAAGAGFTERVRIQTGYNLLVEEKAATVDGAITPTATANATIAEVATITIPPAPGNHTLTTANANKVVEMNNPSAATVTIPTDASDNIPVGSVITVRRRNAALTIAAAGGVTYNGPSSINAQYDEVLLHKRAANSWHGVYMPASVFVLTLPKKNGGTFVAPTRVAFTAVGDGNSTAVAKPAGVGAGDLLLFKGHGVPLSSDITPPDGTWTKLGRFAGTSYSIHVWYKFAGGSEPSTYTFAPGAPGFFAGSLTAYRNVGVPYGFQGRATTVDVINAPATSFVVDIMGDTGDPGWANQNGFSEILRQYSGSGMKAYLVDKYFASATNAIPAGSSQTASETARFIIPAAGPTAHTIGLTDAGYIVDMSPVSAGTVTIPNDSTANLPTGSVVAVRRSGTAVVNIGGAAGVSYTGPASLVAQNDEIWLVKDAANAWHGVYMSASDIASQLELDAVVAALSVIGQVTPTADYTLVLSDAGKVIELDKATAITLNIPTNANVAFPVGTVIELWQKGAGQVNVAAVTPGTTTIRSPGGLTHIYGQYSGATLRKRATDEWVLQGDLA
jgi:hypothetical protein